MENLLEKAPPIQVSWGCFICWSLGLTSRLRTYFPLK